MSVLSMSVAAAALVAAAGFAQEPAPELAESAAKYRAAAEALEKQRLAAAAQAARLYVGLLGGIERAAAAKGEVKAVEAATKERAAALAGALPPELPAELPTLRLQGTRKALLLKLEKVNADAAAQKKRFDGQYLGILAALAAKAAPDSGLAKQVAAEREAVLAGGKAAEEDGGKEGGGAKEAKVPRGKNAVVNGDFEKVDADGKPEGWQGKGVIVPEKEKGRSFIRFVEKTTSRDGTCGYHELLQELDVPAKAQRFRIATRIRTMDVAPPTKNARPGITLVFQDKGGNEHFKVAKWPGKNGSWADIQTEGPIPAEAVAAKFSVSSGFCPGQIDFDDVEVTFK
jgi:hypothetical protein